MSGDPAQAASAALIWVALAREFKHGWASGRLPPEALKSLVDLDVFVLDNLDERGIGEPASSLDTAEGALGGYHYVSKSGRISWTLSTQGVGSFMIRRPGLFEREGQPPETVIRLDIEPEWTDGSSPSVVRVDTRLVQTAEYYSRHTNVAARILHALSTVPLAYGGISKDRARLVLSIVMTGGRAKSVESVPPSPAAPLTAITNEG